MNSVSCQTISRTEPENHYEMSNDIENEWSKME